MNYVKWKNRTWEVHERWGIVHPDYPFEYSDKSCVEVRGEKLILKTKYKPKQITGFGLVPYAHGKAICMDQFHFGSYTIICKLPVGNYLWPAIWMYDHKTWPPEIDIMEAYSNSCGSYFNINFNTLKGFFKSLKNPYKIEANYHINKGEGLGANRVDFNWFTNLNKELVFEMVWSPDSIVMFCNEKIYSYITDKQIMSNFQQPMRFILSNGIRKDSTQTSDSEFVIKDFSYIPINYL